jgi:uncharacterized membrane protein (DUF2068 family)
VGEGQTASAADARRSWLARLGADMGRRIEDRGLVIWYLIVERGLKAVLLLAAAIYIFTHTDSGFAPLVDRAIEVFNLDTGRGLIHDVVVRNLARLAGLSTSTLEVVAVGSLVYGLIEGAESVGLILRRRWAEYLVVLATTFFIPFEVLEVARRPSPLRIITLVLNVVVVVYLVRKKALFQLDHSTEA